MFKIFVSSTYLDLKDHRKAVEEAINDRGHKFLGMEYLGALDAEPTEACLEMVEECDLFIGIYAWRYGSTTDNSSFSITGQEYQYAEELQKPRICYLVDENFAWPPKFIEKGAGADKLEQFKRSIDKDCVPLVSPLCGEMQRGRSASSPFCVNIFIAKLSLLAI